MACGDLSIGHTGLFMLTIVICGLLSAYPRLRDGFDGFNFKIAGRWATQCFLFRAGGDAANGAKILLSSRFRALLKAMCLMHLHFPKAVGDRLHRQIKDVVEQMPTLADRVQSMSVFLEFSFLTHWVSDGHVLQQLLKKTPTEFGNWCWEQKIVPITCRFGRRLQTLEHAEVINLTKGVQKPVYRRHWCLTVNQC